MIDEVGGMSRILVAPLFGEPVPGTPVKRKNSGKNPPAFEGFRNVRVAHNLRCFITACSCFNAPTLSRVSPQPRLPPPADRDARGTSPKAAACARYRQAPARRQR